MDIALSYNGAGIVGDNGDLVTTSGFDETTRRVNILMRTHLNSWRLFPSFGTPLHDYVGQPNTRDTASDLAQILELYLNRHITDVGTISVQIIPIDEGTISIFVFANDEGGQIPISAYVYRFSDGVTEKMYDPAEIRQSSGSGRHFIPTNPYLRKPSTVEVK